MATFANTKVGDRIKAYLTSVGTISAFETNKTVEATVVDSVGASRVLGWKEAEVAADTSSIDSYKSKHYPGFPKATYWLVGSCECEILPPEEPLKIALLKDAEPGDRVRVGHNGLFNIVDYTDGREFLVATVLGIEFDGQVALGFREGEPHLKGYNLRTPAPGEYPGFVKVIGRASLWKCAIIPPEETKPNLKEEPKPEETKMELKDTKVGDRVAIPLSTSGSIQMTKSQGPHPCAGTVVEQDTTTVVAWKNNEPMPKYDHFTLKPSDGKYPGFDKYIVVNTRVECDLLPPEAKSSKKTTAVLGFLAVLGAALTASQKAKPPAVRVEEKAEEDFAEAELADTEDKMESGL